MFNPIFKGNVQGQKHPGSCVFAEPELLAYASYHNTAFSRKWIRSRQVFMLVHKFSPNEYVNFNVWVLAKSNDIIYLNFDTSIQFYFFK